MLDDIQSVLLTEAQLEARVKELGRAISEDFAGKGRHVYRRFEGLLHFYGRSDAPCDHSLRHGLYGRVLLRRRDLRPPAR